MPGERGTIETLTPSDAEIAMARAQLGENGFIVYIACTLDDNFQSGRAVDLEEIANEHNLTYRVYDSENDAYTQINQIDQARLDGARAFILCPLSTDALEPSIDSLQEAHIPLVFTTLYDHPYGVKLDSDSYAIGLRIGSYAAHVIEDKWNGQANVLLLGRPGFPGSESRFDGIEDAIRDIIPDVNILARGQGVTREDAYATVRRFLQQGTTINVIASVNDAGAIGAVDALEEAGIAPEAVDIISSNAEPATVELIRNGMYIRGSVAINREQSARLAIYGVIKQLAGSTVPEYFAFEPGDMITAEVLEAEDGE
jgi:ABC-type sugar transport system substrate-binding protein